MIMQMKKEALLFALGELRSRHGSLLNGARAIGATRQMINHWKRKGQVSHRFALKLANETGVSVHELRPDVFGRPGSLGNDLTNEMHAA
jgi:hypothetical protein